MKYILCTLALLFATLQTFAQTYTYDSNYRLVTVLYENGVTVNYTYDALGNRLTKTVTGATAQTYTITTAVTPSGSGTVTGGGNYAKGTTVELNAIANTGYEFSKWNDGETDNPRTITVTSNKSYTAQFVAVTNIEGDVNSDGTVGIGDIVAVTNVMAGIANDAALSKRADVNGDGTVGIGDIVAITNIMAGIGGTVPDGSFSGQIVMERKYLLHQGGNYNYPHVKLRFDNHPDRDLSICYYNTNYWHGSYSYSIDGIHIIMDEGKNGYPITDEFYKEWYITPIIKDEWVKEKLIVNVDGHVKYYMNDKLMGEESFDGLDLKDAKKVSIEITPYGWWTGHYHYMDYFYLSTPVTTISDDFNDGNIDLSIWREPVNLDGVHEEDGIVMMEQLRTDQDFCMYLDDVPLCSTGQSDNRELMFTKTVDGAVYTVYKKTLNENDFHTNPDGWKCYRSELSLEITKDGKTNSYVLDNNIYLDKPDSHHVGQRPCMLLDFSQNQMIVFCNSKDEANSYSMEGNAYVSLINDVHFSKETVFTKANWGWYPFFSLNGSTVQLNYFSFAGYYSMIAVRDGNGSWTNQRISSIKPDPFDELSNENGPVTVILPS